MLAYLIARGGTPVLRDEVAEALWPDGESAYVQQPLSNTAYYLRRAIKGAMPAPDGRVNSPWRVSYYPSVHSICVILDRENLGVLRIKRIRPLRPDFLRLMRFLRVLAG